MNLVHLEDRVTPADFRDVGGLRFAVDDVFSSNGDVSTAFFQDVQVGVTPTGGNPFKSLLNLPNGVILNTNPATPSATPVFNVTVGGATFFGSNLAFGFDTPNQKFTLSGDAQVGVGSFTLATTFGAPGSATPGLVIQDGKLASVDVGLTQDFTADGVAFDADTLRMKLDTAAGNRFAVTGTAGAKFALDVGEVNLTTQFGASPQKPGLVVVNGQLSELTVGVTGGFNLGGLGVTANDLTFQFNDPADKFSLSGSAGATFAAAGGTSALTLNLGTIAQPGLVVRNGLLESVTAGVTGKFSVAGVSIAANNLTLGLVAVGSDVYELTGSASATFTAAGSPANLNVDFGTPGNAGLRIVTGNINRLNVGVTGGFDLAGLGVQSKDLRFVINRTTGVYSLSGSAGATFQAAGSTASLAANFGTTTAPGVVVQNGSLQSLTVGVTGGFDLDGLSVTTTGLTLGLNPQTSTYRLFGAAAASFKTAGTTANLALDLGTDANPGLQIAGGQLTNVNAGVTSGFAVGGVSVQTKGLTVTFDKAAGTFGLAGSAGASFQQGTTTVALDAQFGSPTAPGLVLLDGKLKSLAVGVTGGFTVGGLSVAAKALTFTLDDPTSTYTLAGTAMASFKRATASATSAVDLAVQFGGPAGPGLVVQNGQLKSLAVGVTGGFNVGGLSITANALTFTLDNPTNTYTLAGTAGASFQQGKSNLVNLNVQFGGPAGPGLVVTNGQLKSLAVGVTGGFKVAGLQFGTDALTFTFDSPTDRYTLSGKTTAAFSGGGAMVNLGVQIGDTANPGLVVTNGTLTKLDLAVTSDFTVAKVNVRTKALRFTFDSPTNTYTLGGSAGMSFAGTGGNGVNFDVSFGGSTPPRPGLVITNGALQSLDVGVTGGFKVAGLSAMANGLTFSFNRANNAFGLSGGVKISTGGPNPVLNNVGVNFNPSNDGRPGLLVVNGQLERIDVGVSGKISLGPVSATSNGLRVSFERSTGDLQFTGGLSASVAGTFSASVDFINKGLFINTNTGVVELDGLELRVDNAKIGPIGLNDVFVRYAANGNSFDLSGGAMVTIPSGLTVGGTFDIVNGRLRTISLSAARSPGFPIGNTGVFVSAITAKVENLDDVSRLRVMGGVTFTAGGEYNLFGRSVNLLQGTAGIDLDIGRGMLAFTGKASFFGGLVPIGMARVEIAFNPNSPTFITSVKANADINVLGGLLQGKLDLDLSNKGDLFINAQLKAVAPTVTIPRIGLIPSFTIGGQTLGEVGVTIKLSSSDPASSFFQLKAPVFLAIVTVQADIKYEFNGRLTLNGTVTKALGFITLPEALQVSLPTITVNLPPLITTTGPLPTPPVRVRPPGYSPTISILSATRVAGANRRLEVTYRANTLDDGLAMTSVQFAVNNGEFGSAGGDSLLSAAQRGLYDPRTGIGRFIIPDPELLNPGGQPFTVRARIIDDPDIGAVAVSRPINPLPAGLVLTGPASLVVPFGSTLPFAAGGGNNLAVSDPNPNDAEMRVDVTFQTMSGPSFSIVMPPGQTPAGVVVSRNRAAGQLNLSGPLAAVNQAITRLQTDRPTSFLNDPTVRLRVFVSREGNFNNPEIRDFVLPPVSGVSLLVQAPEVRYAPGAPAVAVFSSPAGPSTLFNTTGRSVSGARVTIEGRIGAITQPGGAPDDETLTAVANGFSTFANFMPAAGVLSLRAASPFGFSTLFGFPFDPPTNDVLLAMVNSVTYSSNTNARGPRGVTVQFNDRFGIPVVGVSQVAIRLDPTGRFAPSGFEPTGRFGPSEGTPEATGGPLVDAGLVAAIFDGTGPVPVLPDLLAETTGPDRITTATVTFMGTFDATSDVLSFTPAGGITGTFDAATGILTLTAGPDTTTADFQTALRSVQFNSTRKNPLTEERQVMVLLTDAAGACSDPLFGTTSVKMVVPVVPPGMAGTTESMNFAPNGAPVPVFPDFVLTYPDADLPPPSIILGPWVQGSRITRGMVSVSTNFVPGEDFLTFTPVGNITGTYREDAGILELTGLGTLDEYQEVIRSVQYQNRNTSPSTADREVVVALDDGSASGELATIRRVVRPQSDGLNTVRTSGSLTPVLASPTDRETTLGLSDLVYAPRPGESVLVYTILDTPTETLGTVRLADGTIAAAGMVVTIEQLRGAAFVLPAAPRSGPVPVQFRFSIAGVNPVTGVPTDTPLVATIPISIRNVEPTAQADAATTAAGTAATIDALANDTDPNLDLLLIDTFTTPANGTVALDDSGNLVYTPNAGFSGTDTFSYTAIDGIGGKSTATVTLTVTGTPPPPPTTTNRVALVGFREFAAGADRGAATASLFNPDGSNRFTISPFGDFTGGVRTTAADFNGDGVADLVVGTGPGRATRVRILDGKTQAELFAVDPFEAAFTGGVFVTTGDLNGDGAPDLIITPDEGGGPRVDVYSGKGFGKLASFFGIDDPNFRGGARASTGDLNGDGRADLIVVAGFGGGPRVAGFDGKTIGGTPTRVFGDFFAFEQTLRNGIFVAAGDLDGDGFADLIAGGGPGGGPRVTAFSGKSLLSNVQDVRANFFGGDDASRGGIRLAVKDLDNDNRADLVVGAGTGAGSRLTAYRGKDIAAAGTPASVLDFDAFAGFSGGVFVG